MTTSAISPVTATLNLVGAAWMRERADGRAFRFYVVPVIAAVPCAATIVMSLR